MLSTLFRKSLTHEPYDRTYENCCSDSNPCNRDPRNGTTLHESEEAQQRDHPDQCEYEELPQTR